MTQEEQAFIKAIEDNSTINALDIFPQLRAMWDNGRLVERDSTIKKYIMNLISYYVAGFTNSPGRYLAAHLRLLVDATIISHDVRMHMAEEIAKMLRRCPNWEWCHRASMAFFELHQHLGLIGAGFEAERQIASSNIIRETLKEKLLKIEVPQQSQYKELNELQSTMNIFFHARFGRGAPKVFDTINHPGTTTVMERRGFLLKKNVPVQKVITRQTIVPKTAEQIIREQEL